jgi:Ala-tRNA(Pro) deacylase
VMIVVGALGEESTMTLATDHLTRRGIRFEVLPHPRAVTAMEEAQALGVDAESVVKTIVLDIATGHALALIPASRRLDLDLVRAALEDPSARLASEEELARDFPEFELGALPPLPSLLHVPVVIDPHLLHHRTITFASGDQRESVRTSPHRLFTGASITISPVTRPLDVTPLPEA